MEKHHQENHTCEDKKPFKCFICNVSYAIKKDLNEHKGEIVMPFKCGNCNSGFWRKQELLNHVLRSHEGKGKLHISTEQTYLFRERSKRSKGRNNHLRERKIYEMLHVTKEYPWMSRESSI